LGRCKQKQRRLRGLLCRWPSITEWEMYITAQGCRLRNDLYCVEWDVKLYYTILSAHCLYTDDSLTGSMKQCCFSNHCSFSAGRLQHPAWAGVIWKNRPVGQKLEPGSGIFPVCGCVPTVLLDGVMAWCCLTSDSDNDSVSVDEDTWQDAHGKATGSFFHNWNLYIHSGWASNSLISICLCTVRCSGSNLLLSTLGNERCAWAIDWLVVMQSVKAVHYRGPVQLTDWPVVTVHATALHHLQLSTIHPLVLVMMMMMMMTWRMRKRVLERSVHASVTTLMLRLSTWHCVTSLSSSLLLREIAWVALCVTSVLWWDRMMMMMITSESEYQSVVCTCHCTEQSKEHALTWSLVTCAINSDLCDYPLTSLVKIFKCNFD